MPATESSSNGAAPSSRLPQSVSAPRREPDPSIEGLTRVLGRLRRGAAALKAENYELRAEIAGLQPAVSSRRNGDAPTPHFGKLADIALPRGPSAPGAARIVIAHCLTGLVSQRVLVDAELLVSELVTNSADHGDLGDGDAVIVRVYLAAETLLVEIENPVTAGVVAPSPAGRLSGRGGFGLPLVDQIAAHWGVSRTGSTHVWFEMERV